MYKHIIVGGLDFLIVASTNNTFFSLLIFAMLIFGLLLQVELFLGAA